MSITDIIARLENAQGGDRELDGAIAVAVGPWTERHGLPGPWVSVGPHHAVVAAPEYTASIDAALTLVPEGWIVAQLRQWTGRPKEGEWFWQADLSGHRNYVYCGAPSSNDAPKTAAIALCIAALKARLSDSSKQEGRR